MPALTNIYGPGGATGVQVEYAWDKIAGEWEAAPSEHLKFMYNGWRRYGWQKQTSKALFREGCV